MNGMVVGVTDPVPPGALARSMMSLPTASRLSRSKETVTFEGCRSPAGMRVPRCRPHWHTYPGS